jgi:thiamine-phosphate pyrophosphorylase
MALPSRIGRLRLPVLCFVVSKALARDGDVEKLVTDAVAGGVTMVQLRDSDLPAGELASLAQRLKAITRGKALFTVNDRIDVAVAIEADGVQVPEAGLSTRFVRNLIGKYSVLGRSVHDVQAAQAANREGADFVIAGTMFASTSKPETEPIGPGLIEDIMKDSPLPVLGIGGITADNIGEIIRAGGAGVAVISAIGGADDAKAAAEALAQALREAWADRPAEVTLPA